MPSLYEILEVSPNATQAEIKRAYKSLALKTHPDRAPPEQKRQAEEAFQKINAAYEVLVNDTARQEYDSTGRIPSSNHASGSSSMPSSPHGQAGFFNPFGGPTFGFGADSLFNEHQRFGAGFNSPFFTSSGFGAFDPFVNDPFFNPAGRMRQRTMSGFNAFPNESFFREVEGMLHGGFPQPTGAFGSRHANSIPNPPAFPFGSGGFQRSHPSGDQNQWAGNNGFQSSFSSSCTTSTYRDGKWTSESVEESNVNGERKRQAQRVWTDDQGIRHVEHTRPDGSRHYLREGENQASRALPPLTSDLRNHGSSRSSHR